MIVISPFSKLSYNYIKYTFHKICNILLYIVHISITKFRDSYAISTKLNISINTKMCSRVAVIDS